MSQINISVREFARMYSEVIGNNPDSQCAIDLINQARIIAYPIGDWVGTIGYEYLPVLNGIFSLSSKYEAIREAKSACRSVTVNTGTVGSSDYNCCRESYVITKLYGRIYSPIQLTENCPLKIWAENKKDEGVEVRVQYTDTKGSKRDEFVKLIFQRRTILQYIPKKIHRLSKPITVGKVGISSGNTTEYIRSIETSPAYSIFFAEINPCSGPVLVKAKKRCILYTIDDLDEILDINPEALSSFIVAVKSKAKREQGWFNDYQGAVKLGVDLLKQEYKNEDDTSVGTHTVDMEEKFFDSILPCN